MSDTSTAKAIKPHGALTVTRPDEVAECWEGTLKDGVYETLWGLVQHYDKIDREECGPHDVIGINSVASFWHLIDDATKARLNDLATAYQAEMDRLFGWSDD